MSSTQPLTSSGSEGDQQNAVVNERKRKRMISNRESARRSRIRKQQHLDDLIGQISELQKQNSELVQKAEFSQQRCNQFESENRVLKALLAELRERVQSLERFADLVRDTSHLFKNLPEISDPLKDTSHLFKNLPEISDPLNDTSLLFKNLPGISDPLLEQPWQLPVSSDPLLEPWQLPVSSDPLLEPLLEPWQLPFSSQPIMASTDMGTIFF
ncbi:bZIP transcription factor 53-like [Macadamia integrifolia]|uniref:bZIP transcription factor 53-like n=1 Tax=Macadamia integrifolia TaxID=60698 RepID=UPI001C4F08AE|nr:bZIP transcription factor 53-like [Macadamia integrifolia]